MPREKDAEASEDSEIIQRSFDNPRVLELVTEFVVQTTDSDFALRRKGGSVSTTPEPCGQPYSASSRFVTIWYKVRARRNVLGQDKKLVTIQFGYHP